LQQAAATLRLFFALWPPSALQAKLAAWARQAAGKGRVMRQENLHLTLAFLGDTDAALLPDLLALAAEVRFAPFTLPLDRVGYWKHNRIIWCGAGDEPQALTALVADLRAGLENAGMRVDPKPFVSHMTLVRKSLGLAGAPRWAPLIWDVRDFALVRSVAVDGGVRYEVMERFPAQAD
jgi:2'-5' RNA ligase